MPTKRSSAEFAGRLLFVLVVGGIFVGAALIGPVEPPPPGVESMQDSVGNQAGLVIILGVLLVSLGLLAAARIARSLVGRLKDLLGMEC